MRISAPTRCTVFTVHFTVTVRLVKRLAFGGNTKNEPKILDVIW